MVAKGDSLGFWPVLGRGHLEKFRAQAKNGKTRFPGARATFGKKLRPAQKFLPKNAQLFYILRFGRPNPQWRPIAKYGFSGPFWPREALGRVKNGKRVFPGATGTFGEIRPPQKFLPKIAQFFYILCFSRFSCFSFFLLFFADRSPRGGKSQNTGFAAQNRESQTALLRPKRDKPPSARS